MTLNTLLIMCALLLICTYLLVTFRHPVVDLIGKHPLFAKIIAIVLAALLLVLALLPWFFIFKAQF